MIIYKYEGKKIEMFITKNESFLISIGNNSRLYRIKDNCAVCDN